MPAAPGSASNARKQNHTGSKFSFLGFAFVRYADPDSARRSECINIFSGRAPENSYRPVYCGLRFSTNARAASFWSSVPKVIIS
jgi:hypothetical protein